MDDKKIAKLAARHEQIKKELADLEKEKSDIQEALRTEMLRRGEKSTTLNAGWKLTRRSNKYTTYDPLVLRRRLRKKPDVLKRIFVETLDTGAVKAEIDAGNISLKTLDAASTIRESEEWVQITPVKGT